MSVTPEVVRHIASLARLTVPAEDEARYAGQMSSILAQMEALGRLPTEGVAPMSHAVDIQIREREDHCTNGDRRAELLSGAPDAEEGHFRVPRILE
jgi:aspartyl-tRNA(Asn)/glutamyl-tRNA(Gln) amidotransferase subunit C